LDQLAQCGVKTVSFSPVLNLTSDPDLSRLCPSQDQLFGIVLDELLRYSLRRPDLQLILDLPLSWTALAVEAGFVRPEQAQVDRHGTVYIQPEPDTRLFLKVQLLPLSTWCWARVTADGLFLTSTRMAASSAYRNFAVGSIRNRGFQHLHEESLRRSGWLTAEWEGARQVAFEETPALSFPVLR
jgi:hypothetical protein